jgi:hypothetical protein
MFRCTIKSGQLTFGPVVTQRLAEWAQVHEGAQLILTEEKAARSNQQSRYYWLFLGVIERETGQLSDDVHEWAKRKFLPPRFITVNGEEMRIAGSTKGLSKGEFTDYLDRISAETGVPLPDSEAAGYISNYEPKIH